MNLATQRSYLRRVSVRLERFTQKSETLWNCRCPYCGDSEKNQRKARGYFFIHEGDIVYKCHNCEIAVGLAHFLKNHDATLYKAWMLEKMRGVEAEEQEQVAKLVQAPSFLKLEPIRKGSIQEQYLLSRCIESKYHARFFSVANARAFADSIESYKDRVPFDVPAVGIPFYDAHSLSFVQLRLIGHDSLRYVTMKLQPDAFKAFGLRDARKDRMLSVLEGAFDAIFVYNAIAVAGVASAHEARYLSELGYTLRFIYDADYKHNVQVRNQLLQRISEGHHVVCFDDTFTAKDLNEAIQSGSFDYDSLNQYLDQHTFQGARAKIAVQFGR